MSDTYQITIESIRERVVCARVQIVNFQFSWVPSNRCFGLQVLADAYAHLQPSSELAAKADARLVGYSEQLRLHHHRAFNTHFAQLAEAEIVRVVELANWNFDKVDAWQEQNERGDAELAPFRGLEVAQRLELEVVDGRLLDHLAAGLTWSTAMYPRDEIGGMGHARPAKYGASRPRNAEAFSPRVRRLFSFGREFSAPWPDYVSALGLEPEDIPELVEIVATWDLSATNSGYSDEQCGPRHAWRALGQLRASDTVAALLEPMLYQRNEEGFDYTAELPTVLSLIGPAAIPELEGFLERSDVDWPFKLTGLKALVALAKLHPEVGPNVERITHAMLERHRTYGLDFNAAVVNELFELELEDPARVRALLCDSRVDWAEVNELKHQRFLAKYGDT